MCSDSQLAANQANAQKSTGPKTAEGKANSRRNALKHGMASDGSVLPPTDDELFKDRLHHWTNEARPNGELAGYLIATAALASVKLDRAARREVAEMNRRRRRAISRWEGGQSRKISKVVAVWDAEPAACVAQLQQSTRGCEWLLARWEELAQALETKGCWDGDQAATAMRLLGKSPATAPDPDAIALRNIALAAHDAVNPDEAETKRIDQEAARESLWEILDVELEKLGALRADHWAGEDGPALSEKIDLATFDHSRNGELRRRYVSAASLELHRALNQLVQQRKEAANRQRNGDHAGLEPSTGQYDSSGYGVPQSPSEAEAGLERGSELGAEAVESPPGGEFRNEPKSAAASIAHASTSGMSEEELEKITYGVRPGPAYSGPPIPGALSGELLSEEEIRRLRKAHQRQ